MLAIIVYMCKRQAMQTGEIRNKFDNKRLIKMQLKKWSIFLCFLIVALSTGCSGKMKLKEEIFQLKRPVIKGEEIEVESFLNPYITKESLSNSSLNGNLAEQYNEFRVLTYEKVTEDLDILFERLKTTYGGYISFGGQGVFEKSKINILKEIGTKNIEVKDFLNIIKKNLGFINDCHFLIGGERLKEINKTKLALDLEFIKENGSYRLKNSSIDINIKDYENYIKPSIDEDGNITYKIFYKTYDKDETPNLNMEALENIKHGDNIEPQYEVVNDVPILKIKRFYQTAYNSDYYDFVIDKAKHLSKSEYSILDLRGNIGGNGLLVYEWLKAYSGNSGKLSGDIVYYINLEESIAYDSGQTTDGIKEYFNSMGIEKYDENHYFGKGSDEIFDKEGTLFVLIDGESASASEHMIDILKHYSNTIFVGVPSKGMMVGSSSIETVLPNSKISFYWGNSYINFEPEYFREFYGFEPDIWVEPAYAEERILKLIEKMKQEDIH